MSWGVPGVIAERSCDAVEVEGDSLPLVLVEVGGRAGEAATSGEMAAQPSVCAFAVACRTCLNRSVGCRVRTTWPLRSSRSTNAALRCRDAWHW
jgi:hypothetical protein